MNPETDSRPKWLILLAVGSGTFMSALDGSVINIIQNDQSMIDYSRK